MDADLLSPAPARLASSARGPAPPAAVVAVPVPPGQVSSIRDVLLSLAASRAAGGVPVAPGSLAVLVLAADPGAALPVVEAMAREYPFPLRVGPAAGDAAAAVRRAAAWAEEFGRPRAPVLLAEAGRPVAPRWAHAALAALRDGADLVAPRAGALRRLVLGDGPPAALSWRARLAMEAWLAEGASRGPSPWRRPERSRLVAAEA